MTNDAEPNSAAPPPGAAPPPPGHTVPPEPSAPPGLGGFAGRYGLVRPLQGRYLAGVCAGIGRATNTDPVLWRVLVAVLTLFGGIGLLVYLVGWLLTPGEGDTASPIEALVGRGRSRTSPLTVVLIGVLAVVMLTLVVSDSFYAAVLGATVLVGAMLLVNRVRTPSPPVQPYHPPPAGFPANPAGYPAGYPASYPGGYPGGYPASPAGTGPPEGPSRTFGGPPEAPAPTVHPAPPGATGTQVTAMAQVTPPVPPPGAPPGGYRPPFAPHGPYGGPPGYPPGPPPVAPPPRPRPPKPPRERSPLGQIVISVACLAIGVLVAVDVTSGRIAPSAYFATILAVIGAGLLVGAWLGRARVLIIVGLVVATALGISSGVEGFDRIRYNAGDVRWHPKTFDDLANSYELGVGDATLDLRDLDFTGQDASVNATVNLGSLRVLLPPNVDTDVSADVSAGDATVLSERWGGLNPDPRNVRDLGVDGAGGGHLRLVIHVNAGELEVTR